MNKMFKNVQKCLDYADYSKFCGVDKSLDKNCDIWTNYTIYMQFYAPLFTDMHDA